MCDKFIFEEPWLQLYNNSDFYEIEILLFSAVNKKVLQLLSDLPIVNYNPCNVIRTNEPINLMALL